MAKNTAIICEFNPLHNGHKAILAHAGKEGNAVIAIMSGNFTQRSEGAVFDKYKRARLAVSMGADAVLELPFPWCSASGEFFALGGVGIAAGLGIDSFVFGSETGDTDYVKRASRLTVSEACSAADNKLGAAVSSDNFLRSHGISLSSNDKLAAEYMRAAVRLGITADFSAYKRMTADGFYRSATDIRQMIYDGEDFSPFVPTETIDVCGRTSDIRDGALEDILFHFYRIKTEPSYNVFDAAGGVGERLAVSAAKSHSGSEFFRLAATKKYTNSRLRRAALFSLLGVSKSDLTSPPAFTVLLAANEKGRRFLADTKKTRSIAVLTKPSDFSPSDESEKRQYDLWCRADEVYSLCLRQVQTSGEYLRRSPAIL
ncbi:MAG: nucleotidyltransferase family protein [Clostridia bacterium]|nr:nucleotidyltransferase family protein [Clostridia bacterium]